MIERLTLTNFRNHQSFRIDAGGRNVILSGPNGAGKTNALEAVSLLAGSSGLRHAASPDMATFGKGSYAVCGVLSNGVELSVWWESGLAHRRAKINGENAPLGELPKHIGIIWLTPAEDLLFVSAPSTRRAFLDGLIAGFDPRHAGRVMRLAKLLSMRAFALKTGRDDTLLSVLENDITLVSAAIADARVAFAAGANHFFEGGEIAISGLLESKVINGEKPGDFEEFYRKYLAENRTLAGDKMVIDGAHKTDFSVRNVALGITADKTSSGQQKLILDKMAIAAARLMRARSPNLPIVVLLDEADGHLDARARSILFAALSETAAQIWVAGIEPDKLCGLANSVNISLG